MLRRHALYPVSYRRVVFGSVTLPASAEPRLRGHRWQVPTGRPNRRLPAFYPQVPAARRAARPGPGPPGAPGPGDACLTGQAAPGRARGATTALLPEPGFAVNWYHATSNGRLGDSITLWLSTPLISTGAWTLSFSTTSLVGVNGPLALGSGFQAGALGSPAGWATTA